MSENDQHFDRLYRYPFRRNQNRTRLVNYQGGIAVKQLLRLTYSVPFDETLRGVSNLIVLLAFHLTRVLNPRNFPTTLLRSVIF